MSANKFGRFLICLFLCVGGGWLTGLITQNGVKTWYPHLIKSPLTPPDSAFPIAWTILYFLMAVSLYLLWSSPIQNKKKAYFAFAFQLALNFLWSTLFFYAQQPFLALIDIVILWIAIVYTIKQLNFFSKLASNLLIPYLFWVTFAIYLNGYIWIYN